MMGKVQKWSFTFHEIAKMGPRQKVAQKRHQRSEFLQNRHREAFSVNFPVKCHVTGGIIVISLFQIYQLFSLILLSSLKSLLHLFLHLSLYKFFYLHTFTSPSPPAVAPPLPLPRHHISIRSAKLNVFLVSSHSICRCEIYCISNASSPPLPLPRHHHHRHQQ